MTASVQTIAEVLLRLVSLSPGQRILGARLGALVKMQCPEFSPASFQARNLRQFIRVYVPAVSEMGRSGPDFVYGIASGEQTRHEESPRTPQKPDFVSPPTTTFNWKAFSNPSYPFALAANRETGEFQLRPLGAEVLAPWVLLPKPSSDEHLAIAKAFVQTLPEPIGDPLRKVLSEPKWFIYFTPTVKRYGVGQSWAAFRTSQLRLSFEQAVDSLGIPAKATEGPPVATLGTTPATTGFATVPSLAAQNSQEALLRRLVSLVVSELPLSELRALSLPVGRVFDHITQILK